jgi:GrpB-like predicted nucleotidyltransferase (UPF0157 family)
VKIDFPSREFDEAVAAVCHGLGDGEQMRALNELLRANAAARDEYLFRAELHARLASEPDLFACESESSVVARENILPLPTEARPMTWAVALAACVALIATG